MAETIVTQELAIRAAIEDIADENTLLVKDNRAGRTYVDLHAGYNVSINDRGDVLYIDAVVAGLTHDRVLISDGDGDIISSNVTTTTLGYLDATSSIQTQLNSKVKGSGTAGHLAKWTDHNTIADSIISESGTVATVSGSLNISTVENAGTDTDQFLVRDASGNVDIRTGAQVAADIGAVSISGLSSGYVPYYNGATLANSAIAFDGTDISFEGDISFTGTNYYAAYGNDWCFRYIGSNKVGASRDNFGMWFGADDGRYQFTDYVGAEVFGVSIDFTNATKCKSPLEVYNKLFTVGDYDDDVGGTNYFYCNAGGVFGNVGTAGMSVQGNRYAFQYGSTAGSLSTTGMYFSATNGAFEFHSTGVPVFTVSVGAQSVYIGDTSVSADARLYFRGATNTGLITWDRANDRFLFGDTVALSICVNAGVNTDQFLVRDASGNIDYRTGAEVAADIGAVSISGLTNGYVPYYNGSILVNSIVSESGTTITVGGTLNISTVVNAGVNTDQFLVRDASGNIDIRTGAQVLSDIGGITGGGYTINRVLISDGSGNISASSVTTTILGYLDATSSIQTQLDNKLAGGGTTGYLGKWSTTKTLTNANIFDSGSYVSVVSSFRLGYVVDAEVDTDKFLVLDASGNVDYRTGAEVLSDIGAVAVSGLTNNYVPYYNGSVLVDSGIYFDKTNNDFGINSNTPREITGSFTYSALSTDSIFKLFASTNTRLVIKGSSAAIDFVDAGGGANEKWIQADCDSGLLRFISRLDTGAVNKYIMAFDMSTGYVGIGTTTPDQLLHIHNSSGNTSILHITNNENSEAYLGLDADGGVLQLEEDDGTIGVLARSYGDSYFLHDLAIGTTTPETNFHVAGTSKFTGTMMCTGLTNDAGNEVDLNASNYICVLGSSRRFKHNIRDSKYDTSLLHKLRLREFEWNSDNSWDLGFVAEEVKEVCPGIETYRDGKVQSWNTRRVVSMCVAEIQRLNKEIESFKNKENV